MTTDPAPESIGLPPQSGTLIWPGREVMDVCDVGHFVARVRPIKPCKPVADSPLTTGSGLYALTPQHAHHRIRVLIVDDPDTDRRGLRAALSLEPDLEVVAEATSSREAAEKCFELEPDIILLDVRFPGGTGYEACTAVQAKAPHSKILILTYSDDEADLFVAIKAGARGYLLGDPPAGQIATTIRLAHAG